MEDSQKKIKIDWKQRCIECFGLKPCLDGIDEMENEEEVWKKYYEYRCQLNPVAKESDDDDADDEYSLFHLAKVELQEEANEIGEAGQDFVRSTKQTVLEEVWEDYDSELRTSYYWSCIYSPYQIPHVIEFSHRYHRRVRYSSIEFSCWWAFKLVRFDGEGPGDKVQQKLAKQFPKGWVYEDPKYEGDAEFEYLCRNGCMDPPEEPWSYVENIDISNLTVNTIRRIREWLYGVPCYKSVDAIISDFDLMRLLFASVGTAKFVCFRGEIGYEWRIAFDEPAVRHLVDAGFLPEHEDDWPTVSWLEHQVRLITSSLRPLDRYYESYDQLADKANWGKEVLSGRDQQDESDEDGAEEREPLHEVPWLLWDRKEAERKARSGGGEEWALMLSRVLGQQFNH